MVRGELDPKKKHHNLREKYSNIEQYEYDKVIDKEMKKNQDFSTIKENFNYYKKENQKSIHEQFGIDPR